MLLVPGLVEVPVLGLVGVAVLSPATYLG